MIYIETKLCRRCKIVKLQSDFNKTSYYKDGLQKYCRDCTKILGRQYKERKAAREGRVMQPYKEKKFSQVSEEELLEYLRKFTRIHGRPPTTEDLENNADYPCAYTYYRRFNYKVPKEQKAENWNAILALANIELIDTFSLWKAWEYLVECAVKAFETDYIFQYTGLSNEYRPDIIIPSKNLIIDAATSNYLAGHKKRQYENARKHGYNVEFWCLYRSRKKGLDEPNLTYVFAGEIIERLRTYKEFELIEKIETILERHNSYREDIISHKKEYLKSLLLDMYNQLKRTPTTRDFEENPNCPSVTTISKVFGSFNAALEYSGLPINRKKITKANLDIAISDLINLTNKLNRIPKNREIGPPNTTYTIRVYYKNWGSLANCLMQAGYPIDKVLECPVEYCLERACISL